MATINTNVVTPTAFTDFGASLMVACTAGGDGFVPGNRTFVRVNNGSGAGITVTFVSALPCGQANATHNQVVVIPAGQYAIVGPFDPRRFAQPNGLCNITYSGVTSLTIAAYQLSSDPT